MPRRLSLLFCSMLAGVLSNSACWGQGGTCTITPNTPAACLSSTSLTFAGQHTGTVSAAQTIALRNCGSSALLINSITASGDFAQTNDCGIILAATTSCTVTINFSPTVTGPRTGMLKITDNGPDSPQWVTLSGAATAIQLSAAVTTGNQIGLSWTGMAGASRYDIYRKGRRVDTAMVIANVAAPTTRFTDSTTASDTTYSYQVLAVLSDGSSAASNVDQATTVVFTDNPIVAGVTVVKAQHLAELRRAVNAQRVYAGLTPFTTWTDAGSLAGLPIRIAHIQELRDKLKEALGVGNVNFSDDPLAAGVVVRAGHLNELRQAVR